MIIHICNEESTVVFVKIVDELAPAGSPIFPAQRIRCGEVTTYEDITEGCDGKCQLEITVVDANDEGRCKFFPDQRYRDNLTVYVDLDLSV